MESLVQDPFASKGVEYLICLAFLGSLPAYWRHLNGAPKLAPGRETALPPTNMPDHATVRPRPRRTADRGVSARTPSPRSNRRAAVSPLERASRGR